jgi:S1-C subfamily serine protease
MTLKKKPQATSRTKPIKKVRPNKAIKVENGRAETIKEIYLQDTEIKLPQHALNWTAVVIISLLFGLVAGFFGSWWQIIMKPAWLYPDQNDTQQISEILETAARQNDVIKDSFDGITTQNLSNQSVLIYLNNFSEDSDEWDGLYTEENFQGSGLIVTSDGWLVTTSSVINDVNDDFLIITSDRRGFEPIEFVIDEYNDLVFVKIEVSGLSPITIRSTDNIKASDDLLVLRNTLKYQQPILYHTKLMARNYTLINDSTDFLHSTNKNDIHILLKDNLGSEFVGASLANSNGEVIGLITADGDENTMTVTGFNLQVAVRNFLSSEAIVQHNTLDIHYLDLSEVVGLSAELHRGYNKGALIYGNDDLDKDAVEEDGVAAIAKLVSGDIILAINDQSIESGSGLNRLLQEYPLGSTVTLTVFGLDNEIKEVIITLDINP